ncbi:HAD-IIB family hydrolase [Oenococcus oeni]|uniref:HAD-IIB family hydrolase n=1 Tax=Oenococcus oeni TaxID=1247 RepID=UPI0007A76534|nr:HAD-IIB family hydrolase [Oenococcus oeni]KZD13324.1 HMP-PP hydrolase [Oenococcus oeni]
MNPIKLFASDIDGTFVNDKKTFNQKLFQATLDEMNFNHQFFVAASGRSYSGIAQVFKNYMHKYNISFVSQNGASVYVDGKNIFRSSIDPELLEKVFYILPELSIKPDRIIFEGDLSTYATDYQQKSKLNKMNTYNPKLEIIHNFSEIKEPIEKIALFWKGIDQKLMAEELISKTKIKGVRATSSGYGAIDIINRGISKAIGLQKIGNYLGLHHDQMAAFGDGENDLEMLYYVAHPFVMPNAPDFIKREFSGEQIALSDNNHDGVLKTIDKLITK